MPYRELSRIASAAPSRPFRIVFPIVAVLFGFCAICIHAFIEARFATRERAADAAASLVTVIESDLVRNIETLNLSLQAVVDGLKRPDILQIDPELRQLVLFDRAATAKHIGAIFVLDEQGYVRFDSRTTTPEPLDLSSRDYFKAHLGQSGSILHIGQPQAAKHSDNLFIGISRRLSHPDGSFAGVVTGTLRLSYFRQLFKDLALGPNSSVTLARTDGAVLMQWPYEDSTGYDIQNAELHKRVASSPKGQFETDSTAGTPRLVTYKRISDLPIVIGIGQSTHDIYAVWRKSAWTVGALVTVLLALSGMLSLFLMRDLQRRSAAEQKLAALAITDGLTGLSNRWHFDETIRNEWLRLSRTGLPLALLMIDADMFKQYNDRHGHQAGDRLLKGIGTAIAGSIRRGADLGARYGGDEFAVLLPETPLEGAARVANRIRERIAASCGDETGVRVSIGVASLVPSQSAAFAALLTAADGALYRAKDRGRDRIELAAADLAPPQPDGAGSAQYAA